MMDTLQTATNNNIPELIVERKNCLPSIISSINDVDNSKLLDSLQQCVKYLPTYDVLSLNEELLQHIMPVMKRSLQKIYEDNFLLADTCDDDIIMNILKENIQIASGFIQITKIILEFLLENSEIYLNSLNQTPLTLVQFILITFEHVKNSTDVYKSAFNKELLEIFHIMQDIHLMFLRLFESHIVIENDTNVVEELNVLNQVLDIICSISQVLFDLNVKSMGNNWKGYTAIIQKFSVLLNETIDLNIPIQCLTQQISKNLSSISVLDEVDLKLFPQVVKITGFLIKVGLKIFDIFWSSLYKISKEIVTFCCMVYSYPADFFRSQGYPRDILEVIENSISKPLEPFLVRLISDAVFPKIFSSENISSCECSFGCIILLSNILKLLVLNEEKLAHIRTETIISAIFNSTKLCYTEFFWATQSMNSVFDNLVLNTTASVLIYDECYAEVERILFKNVLQEHVWNALLAIEIWTLLLCNSTPQTCFETLLNLYEKHREIGFGTYTARLEQIYMKCLMQRIFSMLPAYMKNDVVEGFTPINNICIWKMIGFQSFPVHQQSAIEDICANTVEKIKAMERDDFSSRDLSLITDNLELLSTVKFNEFGPTPTPLVDAVYSLWEFNVNCNDLSNNNIFKYFINRLCKVTSNLMTEFTTQQLTTVLSRLKFLSSDDLYKLLVCEILLSLSKRTAEYSQDGYKINILVVDIVYPNLLCTKNDVIKQHVLEVIQSFAENDKHDIVKSVMKAAKDMQGDISNYLQRNVVANKFDKAYFALLASCKFQHECITWRTDVSQPHFKKIKTNDSVLIEEACNIKDKQPKVRKHVPKVPEMERKLVQTNETKDETVTDVIGNIKGEVKCLLKVLKTQQLSKKNATDIRLIANELLSLLS